MTGVQTCALPIFNSGISDENSISAYKAAFEGRFPGIKLAAVSGASATLEERFLADHAAGNQKVDAEISTKFAWIEKALKEKAIEPIDQINPDILKTWPTGSWRWETQSGTVAVVFNRALGIAYNTDLVKGSLVPKQYADLANPAFKDQLLGMDPEASITFTRVWKQIMDSVDEKTMKIGRAHV